MPNIQSPSPEIAHAQVAEPDAPSTLPEREPVRVYGTAPLTVLAIAGSITALGVGSPVAALLLALAIVVLVPLLEAVRARVSPAPPAAVGVPVAEDGTPSA